MNVYFKWIVHSFAHKIIFTRLHIIYHIFDAKNALSGFRTFSLAFWCTVSIYLGREFFQSYFKKRQIGNLMFSVTLIGILFFIYYLVCHFAFYFFIHLRVTFTTLVFVSKLKYYSILCYFAQTFSFVSRREERKGKFAKLIFY